MNRRSILFFGVLGSCFLGCYSREPFKAFPKSTPFMVYYASRYRGLCSGTLVAPSVVITAAVCVINPLSDAPDKSPVTVVVGSMYRHPRRGIRVPITKIVTPRVQMPYVANKNMKKGTRVKLDPEFKHKSDTFDYAGTVIEESSHDSKTIKIQWDNGAISEYSMFMKFIVIPDLPHRAHSLERSPAILLMKRRVPAILTEVPLRALEIKTEYDEPLRLQQECLLIGWHFFYKGDKIYPVHKFLLQRNIRAQFVNVVKMHEWCDALHLKLSKALAVIGDKDGLEGDAMACAKDGMYGSPFICEGRAVGMLMAPDGQWSNCTGNSNIIHMFQASYLQDFFNCVKHLFSENSRLDWTSLKKALYDEREDEYDYIPALYNKVVGDDSESSSEMF